eukprot:COSAG01_NODE_37042_length_509_cov_0.868293_1_plen_114_part_10
MIPSALHSAAVLAQQCFDGACEAAHVCTTLHVAALSTPLLEQRVVSDTVYPALHVGWHVPPAGNDLVQLPTAPLAGGAEASQFLPHVAAVSTAALEQLVVPDTVYPTLHVGWHV